MSAATSSSESMAAYTLPFLLYVVPTTFETAYGMGLTYELICTLKGVLAATALWKFRHSYPRFSTKGWGLGLTTGVLGFFLWIFLEQAQSMIPAMNALAGWLPQGRRAGFDPFSDSGPSTSQVMFVVVRLIELSLIVPIAEELFWRGCLSRYLIAEDFLSVVPGTFTTLSFAVVTIAFTSAHPEVLAAFTWCALINLLYWRTGNLWACILMHAVTNGILGFYVLMTGSWHLW